MADTPKQIPTLSVKKSDGTMVKMTLEEFRVYKAGLSKAVEPTLVQPNEIVQPNIVPIPQPVEELPHNLPMVEESQELSMTTPTIVGDVLKNLQEKSAPSEPTVEMLKPLSKDDFTSLLEEEKTEVVPPQDHSAVSDVNETLAKEVLESVEFLVPKDLKGRLQSLILSRLKDIRNDVQVKEYALLSVESGGLGFDSQKTDVLLGALQNSFGKKSTPAPLLSSKMRLSPVVPSSVVSSPSQNTVPQVQTLSVPKIEKKTDAQKILSSLIAEDSIQAQMRVKVQNQGNTGKVPMHDVVERRHAMGPVDEMLGFSLADFRRLGNTATASSEALVNKFNVLKTDSFLLFLNGKAAWLKSPFYQMYLQVLENSLKTNKPLSSIVANQKDGLTLEEIQEVARVSQSLSF